MAFPLTPTQISVALNAPLANVSVSWPAIEASLNKQGIGSDLVCLAAIATVKVECPPFKPVHEYGTPAYFSQHYEGRADLGNTQQGDGVVFAGRGFIQITGRSNYRYYGQLLGIDLEAAPDRALFVPVAADILALYFKHRGIAAAAEAHDWVKVRKIVNGGANGLQQFLDSEQVLESTEASATAPTLQAPPIPPGLDAKTTMHLSIIGKLVRLIHGDTA